ncbi:MAG TPA: DUF6421 family protein [Solirubrobacteraceae bacterium]|nr:DUF6421 family protein [Solirubrobacteraceae bacterium]
MVATQLAHVLFDEAHSEAWTIDPELASAMQPSHPGDASYARAAEALRERDFAVSAHSEGPLDGARLAGVDVLILAHPSDPAWERTTGRGSPRLSAEELEAIVEFVRAGGGLIVMGETEQEKYGNNLNELLARFELHIENDTVQDYEHFHGAPSWVLAELQSGGRGREGDLLARVHAACLYRATTISSQNGARVLARTHATASTPGAPLIVTACPGAGRLVVLGDSDLFGDDCIDDLDHRELWLNLVYWAAGSGISAEDRTAAAGPGSGALADPVWTRLRDETNALAALQAADGSLAEGADRAAATAHAERIAAAIEALAPRFPHDRDYLEHAVADLRRWVARGMGKPDFTAALEAFRPERQRQDGIEHLVFFPMYKQNGPRESVFEALLIRVPWPDFVAELERTRYDNPKFVPVELLDATRGYDSECAVLFPETVSVKDRPVNNFGAIFCDREAARLRRVVGAAADLLSLNLPPDAARMLSDAELSQQSYILWDLIHDRAHSHGELPFDPFMIRQRSPYWMYSLEELRCDLTAFTQAQELERDGLAFARYVQYAILFDRLLRFPITGPRVRNYDGLGGQLLFAYLHHHGHLTWADNQLTIEWETVGDGVAALYEEVYELYRTGIDRSKLAHWCAAHDFVARYVPPAVGSKWAAAARDFEDVEDPRTYIDLVLADEFPLSIFYSQLKAKLGG